MAASIHQQILGRLKEANWLEPCSIEELEGALSHPDNNQRAARSIQLIRKIWRSFPGLGVPPVLEEVMRLEQSGAFWDRQRDHVVHTLEVYLLGLDLLSGLPQLRDHLSKSIGLPELLRRWAIASLAHDQGYVFEVEGALEVPQAVRSLLRSPLKGLDQFSASALKSIAQFVSAPAEEYDFLANMDTIVLSPGNDPENLLDRLEKRCGKLCFVTGNHPIRDYYQFAQQHGRLYNDHGISGVLLLLHLHRNLAKQVASLEPSVGKLKLTDKEKSDLNKLDTSLRQAEDSIEEGAVAIALHNISKDAWSKQEVSLAASRGIRLVDYSLSLKSEPLSWFLAFVDTLQTWNRPLAKSAPPASDQYIDPADVSLEYSGGRAFLSYANEDTILRDKGESLFWKRRQALVRFLRAEDVDEYLQIGPVATPTEESVESQGRFPPRRNHSVLGVITSANAQSKMAELRLVPRLFPPSNKPVCVLYTGGSVGMIREDPEDARSPLVTVTEFHRILDHLKRLSELRFDIDFYRTDTILDSSNMLPSNWTELAHIIAACYPYYQGFVILHGTDTMTYTASALSFFFDNLAKPIIITGAERPISEIGNDAERNIMTALQLAAPYSLAIPTVPEVCIYFGTKLLRGNRAKKVHALAFEGFDSPNSEHLGVVEDKIDLSTRVIRDSILSIDEARRPAFEVDTTLNDQVGIFEIYPSSGSCFDTLHNMLTSPRIRGLILKTYGTGNAPTMPADFLTYIEQAVKDDKVIINLTHCPKGQVEVRLFETNARLFELGVINGGDMTVEAAYTKLMWLLGKYSRDDGTVDLPAVKVDLQLDLRGELRYSTYNLVYRDCVVPIGKPFIGKIDSIGAFDSREISHAFVRLHDIELFPSPPQSEFVLSVYCNYPRLHQGPPDAEFERHFVGEVPRQWAGSKLTCNLDATEVVRRVRRRKDEPMSLQIVARANYELHIATLQLSVFTENVKGS